MVEDELLLSSLMEVRVEPKGRYCHCEIMRSVATALEVTPILEHLPYPDILIALPDI